MTSVFFFLAAVFGLRLLLELAFNIHSDIKKIDDLYWKDK